MAYNNIANVNATTESKRDVLNALQNMRVDGLDTVLEHDDGSIEFIFVWRLIGEHTVHRLLDSMMNHDDYKLTTYCVAQEPYEEFTDDELYLCMIFKI